MDYKNFGDFITQKRCEKEITMRQLATELDVSAPFLSDVEKDRRNPFDIEKLEIVAKFLELSDEDRNIMMDLAGKKRETVAPDLPAYIMGRDYVCTALRTARDLGASEKEWQKFIDDLIKRKRKKGK